MTRHKINTRPSLRPGSSSQILITEDSNGRIVDAVPMDPSDDRAQQAATCILRTECLREDTSTCGIEMHSNQTPFPVSIDIPYVVDMQLQQNSSHSMPRSTGAEFIFSDSFPARMSIALSAMGEASTASGRDAIENVHSIVDSHTYRSVLAEDSDIEKIVSYIEKKHLRSLCRNKMFPLGSVTQMRDSIRSLTLDDLPDHIIVSIAKKMNLGVRIGDIKHVRNTLISYLHQ